MIDFSSVHALFDESFLLEETRTKNREYLAFKDAFYAMHSAFLDLLSCCLSAPLREAEDYPTDEDFEDARQEFKIAYKNTIIAAANFFKRYKVDNEALRNKNFHKVVADNFAVARDRYELFIKHLSGYRMKVINDTYAAYIYLLRGCNSMIENHCHYFGCEFELIEGVPEPVTLGNVSDDELRGMIEAFIRESKLLHV